MKMMIINNELIIALWEQDKLVEFEKRLAEERLKRLDERRRQRREDRRRRWIQDKEEEEQRKKDEELKRRECFLALLFHHYKVDR